MTIHSRCHLRGSDISLFMGIASHVFAIALKRRQPNFALILAGNRNRSGGYVYALRDGMAVDVRGVKPENDYLAELNWSMKGGYYRSRDSWFEDEVLGCISCHPTTEEELLRPLPGRDVNRWGHRVEGGFLEEAWRRAQGLIERLRWNYFLSDRYPGTKLVREWKHRLGHDMVFDLAECYRADTMVQGNTGITREEILKLFAPVPGIRVDDWDFRAPNPCFMLTEFPRFYFAQLRGMGITGWKIEWSCGRFAAAYRLLAHALHAWANDGFPSVAVGEISYDSEGCGPHRINVVVTPSRKLLFVEPQTGGHIILTDRELDSVRLVQF